MISYILRQIWLCSTLYSDKF